MAVRIVGHWHPSAALTLLGVAVSVCGVAAASRGQLAWAVAALVVAGLCDLFDGPVARSMQRSERVQAYGVQLDSLADMVSFVMLPVALALAFGAGAWWQLAVLVGYAIAAVVRVAYFNLEPEGAGRSYRGLPVTWSALVLGLVSLLPRWVGTGFDELVTAAMAGLAVLFVLDIPVPKPRGVALAGLALLAVVVLAGLAVVGVPVAR